ncbi:MAG: phosphotransferase [Bacilli bacterium]|jgi:hypothetical protein|nr:phosphotransferase [Bacilli bacterium]
MEKGEVSIRTLAELGEPLFTSRSSNVFLYKEGVMLKLFFKEVDPQMIENEFINTTEAFEKGVSQVECYGKVEVEGRKGLLLKRFMGQTLIARGLKKPFTIPSIPKIMASQQIKMHQAHAEKIRSYKELVNFALNSKGLSFLSAEEKAKAEKMISKLPDGDSILHLDYHPDNIMANKKEVTIIDWMTAAKGVPAADVAATLFLLNEGEMIPGLNKLVAGILQFLRKKICAKYVKIYKKKTGMTNEEIAPWRFPFLIVRLGVWNIPSEEKMLQEKILQAISKEA